MTNDNRPLNESDNGEPPDWEDITETEQPKRSTGPDGITDPEGPSLHPEKAAWPPRNVTGQRFKLRNITEQLADAEKSFEITGGLGFVEQGPGYLMLGLGADDEERPLPPESELREAARHPHNYPDLEQPPAREQYGDDATFNEATLAWLVNVAPVVVRRNKYSKQPPKRGEQSR